MSEPEGPHVPGFVTWLREQYVVDLHSAVDQVSGHFRLEDSVRSGWFKGWCGICDDGWYTEGLEPVVVDVLADHFHSKHADHELLTTVKAGLRLVDACLRAFGEEAIRPGDDAAEAYARQVRSDTYLHVLQVLAAGYAGRPGYDPVWQPPPWGTE